MIAQETIDEVIAKASLVEIIGESVELRRAGTNFVGCCPFHNEKTPSFNIRESDRYYHCFGCGASGNVITFIMESQGLSFPDAIEHLAARTGIEIKRTDAGQKKGTSQNRQKIYYDLNTKAQAFFRAQLERAPALVQDYIASRSLSPETISAFQIGFAPTQWEGLSHALKAAQFKDDLLVRSGLSRRRARGDIYDTFRGRLIFPVFIDSQRIAGFGGRVIPSLYADKELQRIPKYLNSPETPIYQKQKIFYGLPQALEAIRASKSVYIVEGYLDVIGLWQAGVRNVVATCGTAFTAEHVKRLASLVTRVKILFDGDRAGRTAAGKSFRVFVNSGIDAAALFLPDGKDPDDIAAEHGDGTGAFLDSLTPVALIDCFIDTVLNRYGVDSAQDLGAASKGKVSEEVARAISQIENAIERTEVTRRAAYSLLVEPETLLEFVEGRSAPPEVTVQETETKEIEILSKLSKLDQDILLAVMAFKQEITSSILEHAELLGALHPHTRQFILSLHEAMLSDEDRESQKEAVKELLARFGKSWEAHWRVAHRMKADESVDLHKTFEHCLLFVEKKKYDQWVELIEARLKASAEEDERADLAGQILQIRRKRDELKQLLR